ncbi:hypothetical protein ACHAXR_001483, partial [Thalassiosira sp. AJA248-18]
MKALPLLTLMVMAAVGCLPINVAAWSSLHSAALTISSKPSLSATRLRSTIQTDETKANAEMSSDDNKGKKKAWFPINIADALSPSNDYNTLVKSAYLRHILVASEEMADLIMGVYLKGGSLPGNEETYGKSDGDILARLAHDVSLCTDSREDGGKVGWVDNPNNQDNTADRLEKTNEVVYEMLSPDVIQMVFEKRVKGGDVIKLPASDDRGWHIIRVDDLHIQLQPSSMSATGSKNIINKKRKKLKGSGQIPLSPIFQKVDSENIINKGIENDDEQSKTIYSVPNAQYYKILTSGCQMNVADSERIMGVLEGEMGLKSLESLNDGVDPSLIVTPKSKNKKKFTPDILLLNTCTIRDHAEQKVYDALGPYTALKRAGRPLAIVVAGCVAQQEGEALLRRFPEVDLVLGPQYIPWLGELLVEVGKGSQLCMTENMIWSEK